MSHTLYIVINCFDNFFKEHPALLYGLAMLIGFYGGLSQNPILILPICCLLLSKRRAILVVPLILASAFFINSRVALPHLTEEGLQGTAHFTISSVALKSTHFGKQWVYKGHIRSLFPYSTVKNVPVSISIPLRGDILRPPADQDYLIEGTLKKSNNRYLFTLEKNQPWRAVKHSFNINEYRYMAKKYVKNLIDQKIADKESATLLSGIATGEFDDRLMSFHFSRFGLQHIMAISGFHFAILAGFLSVFLQMLLSTKKSNHHVDHFTFVLFSFFRIYTFNFARVADDFHPTFWIVDKKIKSIDEFSWDCPNRMFID